MGRDTREVWEKRVARWRESGLTAKEFAAEVGVNAQTLGYWGWRLKQGKAAARGRRPKVTAPTAQWVEVVAATDPLPRPPTPTSPYAEYSA